MHCARAWCSSQISYMPITKVCWSRSANQSMQRTRNRVLLLVLLPVQPSHSSAFALHCKYQRVVVPDQLIKFALFALFTIDFHNTIKQFDLRLWVVCIPDGNQTVLLDVLHLEESLVF